MVSISVDTRQFQADMALYAKLARKTVLEVTTKKAASIAMVWASKNKALMPAKGSIRASRLAALKSGGGLLVRPSALRAAEKQLGRRKGAFTDLVSRRIKRKVDGQTVGATNAKGLNIQALAAQKELGYRERARAFSSYGALMRDRTSSLTAMVRNIEHHTNGGRWHQTFLGGKLQDLSNADVRVSPGAENVGMRLVWGSNRSTIGETLTQSRQQTALREAIAEVHADMMVYVKRKLAGGKA